MTDTDISASSALHLANRELEEVNSAWLDESLEGGLDLSESNGGSGGVGSGGSGAPAGGNSGEAQPWDQFEVNYKLTGKMASYDENMYTTKLDTNKVPG